MARTIHRHRMLPVLLVSFATIIMVAPAQSSPPLSFFDFRAPEAGLGVHHSTDAVASLDSSVAFYAQAFGLAKYRPSAQVVPSALNEQPTDTGSAASRAVTLSVLGVDVPLERAKVSGISPDSGASQMSAQGGSRPSLFVNSADAAPGPVSSTDQDCTPRLDLKFVCGPGAPEDLVRVFATRWIIASGMAREGKGGLFLIDSEAKTARRFRISEPSAVHMSRSTYPDCLQPPDMANFSAHGLSLRSDGRSRGVLYAVGHGEREAIEVFDLEAKGGLPTLAWRGCVMMPPGTAANSVTSLADGTIYATVLARPGTTFEQMLDGEHTGDVYEWKVRTARFKRRAELSLAGNNGIEISGNGRELFVNASGSKQMVVFPRTQPSHALRAAHFDTFTPDNVHWTASGQLMVAGMRDNEAVCGGPAKVVDGKIDLVGCHRGSVVALVDPVTMAVRIVYEGQANPSFTGVATGLELDHKLWLSSFTGNRIAYTEMP